MDDLPELEIDAKDAVAVLERFVVENDELLELEEQRRWPR